MGLALGAGWRATRPAPFHGSEPLFGEMAGEPLVAKVYRETEDWLDRGDPLTSQLRLGAFFAGGVEWQSDDDLGHALLADDAGKGRCVHVRAGCPLDRLQRHGRTGRT